MPIVSSTIKKVSHYRRNGNILEPEYPQTSGDLVQLTAQNGVTQTNAQAELEAQAADHAALQRQLSAQQTELIRWTDRLTALELWAADQGYVIPTTH